MAYRLARQARSPEAGYASSYPVLGIRITHPAPSLISSLPPTRRDKTRRTLKTRRRTRVGGGRVRTILHSVMYGMCAHATQSAGSSTYVDHSLGNTKKKIPPSGKC